MKNKPSRTYKDGVFRYLFNEKEKMLEKIQVLTIDNPLYLGIRIEKL